MRTQDKSIVSSGWRQTTIAELGEVHTGTTPRRSNPRFWGGETAWVTPSDVTALRGKWLQGSADHVTEEGITSTSLSVLPRGSLLVTTRATIGEVAIADLPVTTNQGFKNVVPYKDMDSVFGYYLLAHLAPEMRRLASGSTFDEISKRDFSGISAVVPGLSEQRRIAEILDTVDQAIRHTKATMAKLEQVKAGLLHDLLTRGLDENGELRDPDQHPEQFKDSQLGRTPREWEIMRLHEVVHDEAPICYGIVQTGDFFPDGVPVLAIKDLEYPSGAEVHRCSQEIEAKYARSRVQAGDVLISIKGTIGEIAIVPSGFCGNISRDIARLRAGPSLHPEFLAAVLSTSTHQRRLKRIAVGSTRLELSIWRLRSFQFPIPSEEEQKLISSTLRRVDRRISGEVRALQKYRLLRVGLRDDLLTGRVRVDCRRPTTV